MRKAYIILAHQYPQQVHRLIQRLDDRFSWFFLHIDKKSDLGQFREVLELAIVQMVERVKLHWAGFSFVQAILNGLQSVKESGLDFDRIILLSGQDYPIKSNDQINNFLSLSPYSVFMEHFTLPNFAKWQPGGGMFRVNKYYFGLGAHQQFTAKSLNFLASVFSFLQRKLPGKLLPYAGSTWWIIDMRAMEYILGYVKNNPRYTAFHKRTFAPDELFFQTILLNAPDEILNSISNDNLRLIKWKDIKAAHPEMLTKNNMAEIFNSSKLFARKFDEEISPEVLELIDMYCLRRNYKSN